MRLTRKDITIIGIAAVGVVYLSQRNKQTGMVSGRTNTGNTMSQPYGGEAIQADTSRYVNPSRYQP